LGKSGQKKRRGVATRGRTALPLAWIVRETRTKEKVTVGGGELCAGAGETSFHARNPRKVKGDVSLRKGVKG